MWLQGFEKLLLQWELSWKLLRNPPIEKELFYSHHWPPAAPFNVPQVGLWTHRSHVSPRTTRARWTPLPWVPSLSWFSWMSWWRHIKSHLHQSGKKQKHIRLSRQIIFILFHLLLFVYFIFFSFFFFLIWTFLFWCSFFDLVLFKCNF